MQLPDHKTKIVCTIGPASSSEEVLRELILKGMNVARLNFSHGNLEDHSKVIHRIKEISSELGCVVSILADLPGPKIRIGKFKEEPIFLKKGDDIALTVEDIEGTSSVIPVNYSKLTESVKPGSPIYLNDGFIQLECIDVKETLVNCRVIVGGELTSHKGLNLPGSKMFVDAVTPRDLEIIDFALDEGVQNFSISFIESARDIRKVREYAQKKNKSVFIVAKIEREAAVRNIDGILEAADAIMIARGDLGVEIPIQNVPVVQKEIIHKSNIMSIPVITATQMLESMTDNIRPTRAEATDVANAIMDGTDAVMLSAETAVGKYPVESVEMMAKIAASIEPWRSKDKSGIELMKRALRKMKIHVDDMISLQVNEALQQMPIKYVLTPTVSGEATRHISRFKPDVWILAFSRYPQTCQRLAFQYGVYPFCIREYVESWEETATKKIKEMGLVKSGDLVILTQGQPPGFGKPGGTNFLKLITLD